MTPKPVNAVEIRHPTERERPTFLVFFDVPTAAYAVEVGGIRRSIDGANRWYVFSDALRAVASAFETRVLDDAEVPHG